MTRYLLDTSALVKRYHPEAGTAIIDSLFAQNESSMVVSRLALVELQSAFCLKRRNEVITEAQCDSYWRRALADISAGLVRIARMYARHYEIAGKLLQKYGKTQRLRALDALHLGVAVDYLSTGQFDYFVTADALLLEIAPLESIMVVNPLLANP
jgi:predicted nucleic acid-binding protein